MSENKIKVTASTSKPTRVSVGTSNSQGTVSFSQDTSAYNAKIAEQWATSENLVLGQDYSSKYYANKAKQNADNAKTYEQATKETYNNATEIIYNAVENVETAKNEALVEINERFEEGVGEGVNQITTLVDSSIAEYTDIANQIKQDNSESSQLAQDWAISEVIVDNLDYSAKYWAGKAKDNSGIFYDELADEDIDVEIISGGYVTKSDLELGLDRKQDKGDYATRTELNEGLNTKQAKGNYALKTDLNNLATKSEIPTQVSELTNDSNFATQTQVMQAIANIPQFKLSIVKTLPSTGEKMTLYLIPKTGTDNDVYDEYIWIDEDKTFEHLGTTAVDLTGYVKNTDYSTKDVGGVVKIDDVYGVGITTTGHMYPTSLNTYLYQQKGVSVFISKGTLENNKNNIVKRAITENDIVLTDAEKTSAKTWLGYADNADITQALTDYVKNTDYADAGKAGVIKPVGGGSFAVNPTNGSPFARLYTLAQFQSGGDYEFVASGTLRNVLTQYKKVSEPMTEDAYNALETKDSNTLYLIEE